MLQNLTHTYHSFHNTIQIVVFKPDEQTDWQRRKKNKKSATHRNLTILKVLQTFVFYTTLAACSLIIKDHFVLCTLQLLFYLFLAHKHTAPKQRFQLDIMCTHSVYHITLIALQIQAEGEEKKKKTLNMCHYFHVETFPKVY